MTTITRLIIKPVQKLGNPVFSFKRTYEATWNNSQILAAFNGNLGAAIETQKGSPIYYGSEIWDITGIDNLFHYHEDKERIFEIIQRGSRYHLSPIEDTTMKLDLEDMLLRGSHKSARSALNASSMKKEIYKEVEHGWLIMLHQKHSVVPIGLSEQLSINEKWERYTKRHVTHDWYFPGPSGVYVNNCSLKDTL